MVREFEGRTEQEAIDEDLEEAASPDATASPAATETPASEE